MSDALEVLTDFLETETRFDERSHIEFQIMLNILHNTFLAKRLRRPALLSKDETDRLFEKPSTVLTTKDETK